MESAADAPARPVAEAPALSMSAGFLIAWLIGVVLLLGRLRCHAAAISRAAPAHAPAR